MAALPSSARLFRAVLVVTALFPVMQACGGRSDTEDYLFNSDGAVSAAGADGAGATSSAGGTRSGRSGASTGATSNTGAIGNTGATSNTGATGNTGATSSTGGSGIAGMVGEGGEGGTGIGGTIGISGSAGMVGEAGAPPSGPVVTCGGQACDADTQTCCFAGFGGFSCIKKGQTCNGAVLGCTTNKDCAGDVCCIGITGDIAAASSCKASCDNMGMGRERQLCDTDNDCRMPFRFCTPTVFGVNICTRRP